MSKPAKAQVEGRRDPVIDSIPRVRGELAVGANLPFQRRWWRVERITWTIFILLSLLAVTGATGRGFLANARTQSEDGTVAVEYERVERFDTPSMLKITLSGDAVQGGKAMLGVGGEVIQVLGTQRIIPQPALSDSRSDGMIYQFPAEGTVQVAFALQPARIGVHQIRVGRPGFPPVSVHVLVLP